jgi:hypothetical protein
MKDLNGGIDNKKNWDKVQFNLEMSKIEKFF